MGADGTRLVEEYVLHLTDGEEVTVLWEARGLSLPELLCVTGDCGMIRLEDGGAGCVFIPKRSVAYITFCGFRVDPEGQSRFIADIARAGMTAGRSA